MKYNIKIDWNGVLKALIIALIIALVGTSITFFINTSINNGVKLEQEKIQQNQIDDIVEFNNELFNTNIQIKNLVDSNRFKNTDEHSNIIHELNLVQGELKALTYVITKNNRAMRNDMEELKKIQFWSNNNEQITINNNNNYE